ncbi:MAG: Rpn family recombination-promoting nuclease/putative transposase [Pirellulales bacterium]
MPAVRSGVLGISPMVDFAFKQTFGNPAHPAVTLHFLNAVLRGEPHLTSVEILNPVLDKEVIDDKFSLLDIRSRDDRGRIFNIEMQTSTPVGLTRRLTYYAGCLLVGQLREGQPYENLRPVISICVLQFPWNPQSTRFHSRYRLRDGEGGREFTDLLEFHLLELSKLRASAENVGRLDPLERWSYFLREVEQLDLGTSRKLFPEPEFVEALSVLENIARTPREQLLYEARLKAQRDEVWRRQAALTEGLAQGREQGLAEGLEQGLTQGREKGLVEGREVGRAEGLVLGELIGQIQLLERLLTLTPSSTDDLMSQSLAALDLRRSELEQRCRGTHT